MLADPICHITGNPQPGAWEIGKITAVERGKAEIALAEMQPLTEQVSPDRVVKWLGELGILCAGGMTTTDAEMKIRAYGKRLVDYPVGIFTQESLTEAGRKFKFFPTFGEVDEFLKALADKQARIINRLGQIANYNPMQVEKPKPLTDEQRQTEKAKRHDFVESLKAKYPEFTSKLEKETA